MQLPDITGLIPPNYHVTRDGTGRVIAVCVTGWTEAPRPEDNRAIPETVGGAA